VQETAAVRSEIRLQIVQKVSSECLNYALL
jgi:hypothetical protein